MTVNAPDIALDLLTALDLDLGGDADTAAHYYLQFAQRLDGLPLVLTLPDGKRLTVTAVVTYPDPTEQDA